MTVTKNGCAVVSICISNSIPYHISPVYDFYARYYYTPGLLGARGEKNFAKLFFQQNFFVSSINFVFFKKAVFFFFSYKTFHTSAVV